MISPIMRETQLLIENVFAAAKRANLDLRDLDVGRVSVAYRTFHKGSMDIMSEVHFSGSTNAITRLEDRIKKTGMFDGPLPNPHPGYQRNYRQRGMKWSLQINIGANTASMDIDRWNPNWGVFPALAHSVDVLWHRIIRRDTNPVKVALHIETRKA